MAKLFDRKNFPYRKFFYLSNYASIVSYTAIALVLSALAFYRDGEITILTSFLLGVREIQGKNFTRIFQIGFFSGMVLLTLFFNNYHLKKYLGSAKSYSKWYGAYQLLASFYMGLYGSITFYSNLDFVFYKSLSFLFLFFLNLSFNVSHYLNRKKASPITNKDNALIIIGYLLKGITLAGIYAFIFLLVHNQTEQSVLSLNNRLYAQIVSIFYTGTAISHFYWFIVALYFIIFTVITNLPVYLGYDKQTRIRHLYGSIGTIGFYALVAILGLYLINLFIVSPFGLENKYDANVPFSFSRNYLAIGIYTIVFITLALLIITFTWAKKLKIKIKNQNILWLISCLTLILGLVIGLVLIQILVDKLASSVIYFLNGFVFFALASNYYLFKRRIDLASCLFAGLYGLLLLFGYFVDIYNVYQLVLNNSNLNFTAFNNVSVAQLIFIIAFIGFIGYFAIRILVYVISNFILFRNYNQVKNANPSFELNS